MALEPIGDIADVSLTESQIVSDQHAAQSLSRRAVRYPQRPTYIESSAPAQPSEAQAYARRNHGINTEVN